jgi:tetratricopeptide (TPR) repeat protein
VLLAASFRVLYVSEVRDHPYYLTPLFDASDFHARGMQVMRGEGLGSGIYYKAPAYPFLVGQLYRIVGPRLEIVYVAQMLLGVSTAALVAALGVHWFGAAVGVLAGILFGLYAPLVYFENQALISSSALFASVCAVSCVAFWRGAWGALAAGAVAGLALQLRPINATLLVALLLWMVARPAPAAARVRCAALFLVPVLLLLAPTTRHNRVVSGRAVPISVNGGINFYIGNNLDYDETVAIRPGLRWEALTKRFGNLDDPVAWQRGFYQASFASMREHPLAHVGLFLKKLGLVWNVREIDRNQDTSVLYAASTALRYGVPWAVLCVGGLTGLVLLGRRSRRPHPLQALVWLQVAGVVAFFVTTRYTLALVPWLALSSAWAASQLFATVQRHDRRALVFPSALLVAVLVLAVPDWFEVEAKPFGRPDFDRAQVLARRGQRDAALASYEAAVAKHPDDPDVMFRYGEHLERMGRRDEAVGAYQRTAELVPMSYKPHLALGAAQILRGDLDAAWAALALAEQRGDLTGRTLYDMGLVRERQELYDEALDLFRRSLDKRDAPFELATRRLAVARTLIILGQATAAEAEFAAAQPFLRDARAVPLERAGAWLRAGEPTRALAVLQTVPDLDGSARGQLTRARALVSLGRIPEARAAAERALRLNPDDTATRALVERLEASP